MPDESGKIKGISVPEVPWHKRRSLNGRGRSDPSRGTSGHPGSRKIVIDEPVKDKGDESPPMPPDFDDPPQGDFEYKAWRSYWWGD